LQCENKKKPAQYLCSIDKIRDGAKAKGLNADKISIDTLNGKKVYDATPQPTKPSAPKAAAGMIDLSEYM
jgi:hypothetical protein